MYKPSKRAYGIAVWGLSAVCGPVLGPLVGGFAAQAKGWRWTIWELAWLSGFCFIFRKSFQWITLFFWNTHILVFFFFPETSANNILYRRTMRLRKVTGNERLTCEPILAGENMSGKDVVMMTLVKPITLNFLEPMVFALNLYIALVYGTHVLRSICFQPSDLGFRFVVHLVRIFSYCLHRDISFQPRTRGSVLHRGMDFFCDLEITLTDYSDFGWGITDHPALFCVVSLLPGAPIQR